MVVMYLQVAVAQVQPIKQTCRVNILEVRVLMRNCANTDTKGVIYSEEFKIWSFLAS